MVASPAWGDIEAAIRRLDNRAWNDIYLRPIGAPAETYLAVGGGAGRYVVTGSEAGERFPTLENPRGSETELIALCVGGQLGEHPSWTSTRHSRPYVVSITPAASTAACPGVTSNVARVV